MIDDDHTRFADTREVTEIERKGGGKGTLKTQDTVVMKCLQSLDNQLKSCS